MSEEKKDHFISPISLDYNYTAGAATTRFLKKVSEEGLCVCAIKSITLSMFISLGTEEFSKIPLMEDET